MASGPGFPRSPGGWSRAAQPWEAGSWNGALPKPSEATGMLVWASVGEAPWEHCRRGCDHGQGAHLPSVPLSPGLEETWF